MDPEREAVLRIQTVLSLVNDYKPDGLISWGLTGSRDGRVLYVSIEDSGGSAVYRNEVAAGAYVPPQDLAGVRKDYAAMLKAVLEPFCVLVRLTLVPPTGMERK